MTYASAPVAVADFPPPSIHHGTPAFRRTNLALFAAGFATFGLLYCVQPLMPEFSNRYGVSEAVSALSLSLTTGVLAFAMLFAGALSDTWGRKPVMVASLLSSALLVLLSALMPNWPALLVVRTVLGLTLSGLPAVAMTYLSEEMDVESIGLGMGLYISGSAVGGMGGRLITGVLTDFFDWRVGVAVVGVIGLLAAWIFSRALPPSRHFVAQPLRWRVVLGRFTGMFHDRGLPWLFAEGFLLLGAFVTVYNYLGYRLLAPPYNLSQAVVGLIFGIYLVGTFGFFGGHSIVSSWVGRRGGAAKAQAASVYLFCYYMGSSVAGASGGLFYASHGWTGVALFVAALVLAGLLIALRLIRLPPLVDVATPPTPMSQGAMP